MSTPEAAVAQFMATLAKLKDCCDDEPQHLSDMAKTDDALKRLCNEVSSLARQLENEEQNHRELFTGPVDPGFLVCWRDYEKRFQSILAGIWLSDLFKDLSDAKAASRFEAEWDHANTNAAEDENFVGLMIEIATRDPERFSDVPMPEYGGLSVEDGLRYGHEVWQRLTEDIGFDLCGVLRRRALVPFVLIPRHVSQKHVDVSSSAMLRNLQQAQEAFIFGVPWASVAMMRSIVEVLLRDNYEADGNDLSERITSVRHRLPPDANEAALHRLRKFANSVLHPGERNDLPQMEPLRLEKELVSLLMVVRALLESAPRAEATRR